MNFIKKINRGAIVAVLIFAVLIAITLVDSVSKANDKRDFLEFSDRYYSWLYSVSAYSNDIGAVVKPEDFEKALDSGIKQVGDYFSQSNVDKSFFKNSLSEQLKAQAEGKAQRFASCKNKNLEISSLQYEDGKIVVYAIVEMEMTFNDVTPGKESAYASSSYTSEMSFSDYFELERSGDRLLVVKGGMGFYGSVFPTDYSGMGVFG